MPSTTPVPAAAAMPAAVEIIAVHVPAATITSPAAAPTEGDRHRRVGPTVAVGGIVAKVVVRAAGIKPVIVIIGLRIRNDVHRRGRNRLNIGRRWLRGGCSLGTI